MENTRRRATQRAPRGAGAACGRDFGLQIRDGRIDQPPARVRSLQTTRGQPPKAIARTAHRAYLSAMCAAAMFHAS